MHRVQFDFGIAQPATRGRACFHKRTDRQTNRQTDTQTGRQTDRLTIKYADLGLDRLTKLVS